MSPCDPSSEGLADFLQARVRDIASRWEERVGQSLSRPPARGALRDVLPEFIAAVGTALREGPAPRDSTVDSQVGALAEAHGRQCFHSGLDIATVVLEHSLLRDVILDTLRDGACLMETDALRGLLDVLTRASAEALRCYALERERALGTDEAPSQSCNAEVPTASLPRDETRERLSCVLSTLPVILWSFDTHAVFTLCEGQALGRIGITPDQIIGRSAFELFKDEPQVLQAVERSLRGEAFTEEMEFRGVSFEVSLLPERGPNGAVVSVSGLALDITERLRAEAELRQSEMRYRLASMATSDAVWDWDFSTDQVHWSEIFYRLTGHAQDEVDTALEWWAERVHPDDRERVVSGLHAAVANGSTHWVDEYRFRRGDGSYMCVSDRGYVVRDSQGRAVRMVGAFQDITERRVAEQEAQRRADFEQHLIGIVSHDLRNPLNAISMAAKLLLKQEGLGEPQRRSLHRIVSSAERATRMLRDLLDFTQARLSGALPVDPRPLDLHELTRQVTEEVQLTHPDRRLVVERSGDGRGEWDADRLAQLITNLVNNALTYGDEHCAVRVRTHGWADTVVLSVHNMGRPIPRELMGQLFQPLKRGEGKGGRGSHSIGLGLFIVKHITDAHGGRIRVDSSPENGTTFTVSLPRHPPQARAPARS
ncbi:PAS domain-containing sensor histidine kinase [Hyalangium versicolor]|uniref:PAS domain-containing sensor histidine kinase n=1 Tax=Hyalangium versicolor TaxID=2861190 RepID=UPI001CC9EF79|nr:PAS domain-containing protein [Hyalangium versicolor]